MNEKDIEKFDPTIAELTAIVEITRNITANDLEDKKQLAVVRENRIQLKNARVKIENRGKELRADALKFQKDVIAKEKELVGIIEPEEDRLQAIEEEAKQLDIKKQRIVNLPSKKERLSNIKHVEMLSDEEILSMDNVQFESKYNELVAKSMEVEKAEVEAKAREEQAKIDAENAKIKAEQDKRQAEIEAKEKTILEEQRKIEQEKAIKEAEEKAKKETEERIKREAEAKITADKIETERIEKETKADQDKLKKRKAYTDFLKKNGYSEATKSEFKIEETSEGYVLYKKIDIFKK